MLGLEDEDITTFQIVRNYSMTKRDIPEDWNLKPDRCESFVSDVSTSQQQVLHAQRCFFHICLSDVAPTAAHVIVICLAPD